MLFEGGIHMKKRQWMVQRHTIECADAPYRWDRSYQYLVQWSAMGLKDVPAGPFPQESRDESCHVCAGLDRALRRRRKRSSSNSTAYGNKAETRDGSGAMNTFFATMATAEPSCVVLVW